MQTMTKKGLRLFYSEDEGDSSDDGNRLALATVIFSFVDVNSIMKLLNHAYLFSISK